MIAWIMVIIVLLHQTVPKQILQVLALPVMVVEKFVAKQNQHNRHVMTKEEQYVEQTKNAQGQLFQHLTPKTVVKGAV